MLLRPRWFPILGMLRLLTVSVSAASVRVPNLSLNRVPRPTGGAHADAGPTSHQSPPSAPIPVCCQVNVITARGPSFSSESLICFGLV